VGEGTHRHGKFFLTFLNVSFTLKLDSSPLGEVAGSLGFGEPLLNLVINKLDKGIILLGELLLEDVIVLGPDLLHPLLAHPVRDHDHLLQGEDRLLAVLVPDGGGPCPHGAAGASHGHRVHVHHRLRGARG